MDRIKKTGRILLVHPPFGTGDDKRPPDIFDPHFPWGLGYISGVLKAEGYDIEVFDIYAHQWNRNEVLERLAGKEFTHVLITAMATQYSIVKWLTNEFKKFNKDCIVILGGQLSSFSYNVVLENMPVDICVIGEGERTIVDVLKSSNNLKDVKGIAIKERDKIIKTETRELIENIDELPSPAYELFNMEIYRRNKLYIYNKSAVLFKNQERPHVMAMITGRGCPFKCNFCSRTFKNIRIKSVPSILKEIDFFIDKYDIKGINFVDELLFLRQDMIDHLATELGKRGLLWNGQARVDTINLDRLKFYKEKGLVSIGYGVESGSPDMLKRMNKGITREKIELAIRKTLEAGLHMKMTLIFGYPGENSKSVAETIDMFDKVKHPGRRFCIFTPLPGSVTYEIAKEKGLISDEDQYLSRIYEGYWRTVVNMTEFSDDEIDEVRKNAEREMRNNYKKYLMTLPEEQREQGFALCEEDFEKSFINKNS